MTDKLNEALVPCQKLQKLSGGSNDPLFPLIIELAVCQINPKSI